MSGDLTHRGKPVWASIPRALLRDPSISVGAKAVWNILDDHASPDRPVPFPSQETMAEHLGLSEKNGDRTIRRWLGELIATGWVEVERTGRSNRHVMCWDNTRTPEIGRTEVSRVASDRTPESGRDRTPESGQIGHQSPGKKNHQVEPCEEPIIISRSTQEGYPQAVDNDGDEVLPNRFAALIRDEAHGSEDDGSSTAPEQIAIEVAQALGRRDTTPKVQEVRSIERATTKQGWPAAEVIRRATVAGLTDEPESYWRVTLSGLVNTTAPTDTPRPTTTSSSSSTTHAPRPPSSDRGMSPPVGRQLRPDEGWDRPDIVKAGLAAARAALPQNRPIAS